MAKAQKIVEKEIEDPVLYELCVLVPYPLPQKEEQTVWKEVDQLITDAEAKVVLKDVWGKRGLAYKIGGFTEGAYVIYYIECDPSKIRELDKQLRILKNVLRHMIVKPPKHYKMMKYGEIYTKWEDDDTFKKLRVSQEKQDKIQKQVMEKQKTAAKKATTRSRKTDENDKPKMSEAQVSQEVSKLLDTNSIDL